MTTKKITAFAISLILGLVFACQAQAQINFQCVAVSVGNAINHQCPPDISPGRCLVRKAAIGAVSYFQCTNPATTLRNFSRNRNASIRNYRTGRAAASYQPVRVFQDQSWVRRRILSR